MIRGYDCKFAHSQDELRPSYISKSKGQNRPQDRPKKESQAQGTAQGPDQQSTDLGGKFAQSSDKRVTKDDKRVIWTKQCLRMFLAHCGANYCWFRQFEEWCKNAIV